MAESVFTRRRFGAALIAAASVGLAGCSDEGSDDTNSSDDAPADDESADNESAGNDSEETGAGEFGTNPQTGDLTIYLENEDGESVSNGISIRVAQVDGNLATTIEEGIANGEATVSLTRTGEYSITVESLEDEFEPVEDTVTMEEDEDEGVLIELEGASADEPEDEDAEDENGENDE